MEALLEKEGKMENWNDDRLDELSRRMDAGFAETATKVEVSGVRGEVVSLKEEMNRRFDEVDARFDRFEGAVGSQFASIDGRFAAIDSRFASIDSQFASISDRLDRLNHTLLIGVFGVIAAMIANGIWG